MKFWRAIADRHTRFRRETVVHFLWRVLQLAGKEGANLVIFLVAAKLLSPYLFGTYNYVLAAVFFLIVFGDFGISVAASKFVAEYEAVAPEKAGLVLANGGVLIAMLSAAVTLLTVCFGGRYLGENHGPALYALPLVFLVSLSSLYDGIYRGLKRFVSLGKISLLAGVPSLCLVYPLVARYGLTGALMAQNLYYLVLLIGLAWGYRDGRLRFDGHVCRQIASYAGIIGLIHISFFLYTRADILVLGAFGHIVEIGYYEIVNKFVMIITFPFLAFAQIEAPNVVARYYTRPRAEILPILKRYLRRAFLAAVVFAGVMAAAVPLVLRLFLEPYFTGGVLVIAWLFLAIYVFDVVANFTGNTFIISTGHARLNMVNLVFFGVANVLMDILMVRHFGYLGIAYAKCIVVILGSVSLIFFYWRALRRESAVAPRHPA